MADQKNTVAGAKGKVTDDKQVTEVELEPGEVVLASIKQSRNQNKIMIEFAEAIERDNEAPNVLAELNESDERFSSSQPSIRRHWQAAEKADCGKMGIPAAAIEEAGKTGKSVPLMFKSPTILAKDGKKYPVAIQINDSTSPWNDNQRNNPLKTAKQVVSKKRGLLYLTNQGSLIFSQTTLVAKAARKHGIIFSDRTMSEKDVVALGLGTASDVNAATEALNG